MLRLLSAAERRSLDRVAVPVMKIRIVGMGVDHRLMPVPMRMRFCDRPIMLVLVMPIKIIFVGQLSKGADGIIEGKYILLFMCVKWPQN